MTPGLGTAPIGRKYFPPGRRRRAATLRTWLTTRPAAWSCYLAAPAAARCSTTPGISPRLPDPSRNGGPAGRSHAQSPPPRFDIYWRNAKGPVHGLRDGKGHMLTKRFGILAAICLWPAFGQDASAPLKAAGAA